MLRFLSAVLLTSFAARGEVPGSPRAGYNEIRFTSTYFSTSANYQPGGGGAEGLPNGGSFSVATGELLYSHDWRPNWRFYGGASLGYAESDDGTFVRSNSGLNEILAGAQNWYEMGRLDIAIQGDFAYSIFEPDEGGDEALYGEGAMRLRGGGWAIYPLGALRPFGYLGFEYRNGGRSFLLPYSVGARYRIGRFWLQGEYRGYESVVDDADSENRADRDLFLEQVNGGSYRFYSLNPSVSEIALEAGTHFGAFKIFGGFAITVNGSSAAEGWTAMGGVSFSPSASAAGAKVQDDDFDIRGERFDESLFREDGSGDSGRLQEPQFREDPNFVEPPVAAPPSKSPKQQAIEESQDVEMQIELQHVPSKKKKKKKPAKKNLDKLMKETEKLLEGG